MYTPIFTAQCFAKMWANGYAQQLMAMCNYNFFFLFVLFI